MNIASRDTWPGLRVQVELLPWAWTFRPRVWTDWDMSPSCSFKWLFLDIQFWGNRPLFTDPEV